MKFNSIPTTIVLLMSAMTGASSFAQIVQRTPIKRAEAAVSAESAESAESVRSALAKKEGEGDNEKLLQDTLTAKDRQYSLLKSGQTAMTWDASYAYSGIKQVNSNANANANSVVVSNLKSHSLNNTFTVDYGLANDLAVNMSVPLVARYTQTDTGERNIADIGDMSVGARFQPFPLERDFPTITLNTSVRLPTGTSPFKTFNGAGLSTGSGFTAITGGMNISKIMDPVALFGSLSATYNLKATGLNQSIDGARLTELAPGSSISIGAGFATALSYKVSTSMAYQQTISNKNQLTYLKADNSKVTVGTIGSTSAILNFGLGVRYSPASTVNFSFGVGLTSDSPDFIFGFNMPLTF